MSAKDELGLMLERFRARDVDVLITTRWFGSLDMDKLNATMLIVLAADHFGLEELLRFHDRLVRIDSRGFCVLITDKPEAGAVRTMIERVGTR